MISMKLVLGPGKPLFDVPGDLLDDWNENRSMTYDSIILSNGGGSRSGRVRRDVFLVPFCRHLPKAMREMTVPLIEE